MGQSELITMRRPGASTDGLKALVARAAEIAGAPLGVVEVGSYRGESARIMCRTGLVSRIWCVDKWKAGYDPSDPASPTASEAEKHFDAFMAEFPRVVHKFKGTLRDFREKYPDVRPSLVYVDADHRYEAVKADIQEALKMKPVLVGGHDFQTHFPGVQKAVNEEFGKIETFIDTSWLSRAARACSPESAV